jgi:hypothetical protein
MLTNILIKYLNGELKRSAKGGIKITNLSVIKKILRLPDTVIFKMNW